MHFEVARMNCKQFHFSRDADREELLYKVADCHSGHADGCYEVHFV
jgi:hypothetical protein